MFKLRRSSREIVIEIEDGVTTSQKIKEEIDNSPAGQLLDVIVYGSVAERVYPVNYEQSLASSS